MMSADVYLDRLHRAANVAGRPLRFMEVCGTHTMSAFRSGLPGLLPDTVELLSGPGCPVCVTDQADIDAILARERLHEFIDGLQVDFGAVHDAIEQTWFLPRPGRE